MYIYVYIYLCVCVCIIYVYICMYMWMPTDCVEIELLSRFKTVTFLPLLID